MTDVAAAAAALEGAPALEVLRWAAATFPRVALATSLALLFVDAGQPDVRLFRIGLAAWGIGGAAAALMQSREDFQS